MEYQGLSDVELNSEETKKNYQPSPEPLKHYEVDVEEIDHSLGGDD